MLLGLQDSYEFKIKISNIDYIIIINKTYNTKALSQLVGLEDTYKMK